MWKDDMQIYLGGYMTSKSPYESYCWLSIEDLIILSLNPIYKIKSEEKRRRQNVKYIIDYSEVFMSTWTPLFFEIQYG